MLLRPQGELGMVEERAPGGRDSIGRLILAVVALHRGAGDLEYSAGAQTPAGERVGTDVNDLGAEPHRDRQAVAVDGRHDRHRQRPQLVGIGLLAVDRDKIQIGDPQARAGQGLVDRAHYAVQARPGDHGWALRTTSRLVAFPKAVHQERGQRCDRHGQGTDVPVCADGRVTGRLRAAHSFG